ncbi:hypothetical protein ACFL6P_01215 [Candidatus Latescibacterota bacterium]
MLKAAGADPLETVMNIQRCSRYDVRNLLDEDGNFKRLTDIDYDTRMAIQALWFITRTDEDGKEYTEIVRVKMVDKLKFMELLGEFQGLFMKNNNVLRKGGCGVFVIVLEVVLPLYR